MAFFTSDELVVPHGGNLVNLEVVPPSDLERLHSISVSDYCIMDLELLGTGAFSPLLGFMDANTLDSVLNQMCLPSGLTWSIPIILDVTNEMAEPLNVGERIAIRRASDNEIYGMITLSEKYPFQKLDIMQKWFGTTDIAHPGVKRLKEAGDMLLAGQIQLFKRRKESLFELTPSQTRKYFKKAGWKSIYGFVTRNIPHRSHEFIHTTCLNRQDCDAIFIQSYIGKSGDFHPTIIGKAYESLVDSVYAGRALYSHFSAYTRFSGPRDAIFAAICKKNFGCNHMIIGRSHGCVGNFYTPCSSKDIFSNFPNLGITLVPFENIVYDKSSGRYVEYNEEKKSSFEEISGTEIRKMLLAGKELPDWFLKNEISKMVISRLKNNERVFIP